MQNIENKYEIYGLTILSEIYMKELIKCEEENRKIDVVIKYSDMPNDIMENIKDNKKSFFSKEESWFYIEDAATYRIINGKEIHVQPNENVSFNRVKTFLLGTAFGLLLIQRNIVAIHGGAIVHNNKAFIITGDSGAGKSTLVSAFRYKNYNFLSDDVCATTVEGKEIYVNSAYPQQKLCEDAVKNFNLNKEELVKLDEGRGKYAIPSKESFILGKEKLCMLIELSVSKEEDDDDLRIEEITGTDKMVIVMKNVYRINLAHYMKMSKEYFNNIATIAKNIKVYRLIRPKDKFTVFNQIELIKKLL